MRNEILETKLNKINEVFDVTESVVCSMDENLKEIVPDRNSNFENDFNLNREVLISSIATARQIMDLLAQEVQLGNTKAADSFASILNSMNSSIRLLSDIYLSAIRYEKEGKDPKESNNNIANQVNVISANINDIIKQIKES